MILVTTDGSTRSLQALPHAARLADALSDELVLVRVLDPRSDCAWEFAPTLQQAVDRVSERWHSELDAALGGLAVPARAHVAIKGRREDVSEAIIRTAREGGADLVAISTKGAGAIKTAALGSVSTGVIREAETPVMLVGPKVSPTVERGPYHLLITSDGSPSANAVLPDARRLLRGAPATNFDLTLLRVYRPTLGDPPASVAVEECRRELARFGRGAPRRFPITKEVRKHERLGGTHRAVLEAARELNATALWMASRGHSLRRRVLLGSVTLSAVSGGHLPVVVSRAFQ